MHKLQLSLGTLEVSEDSSTITMTSNLSNEVISKLCISVPQEENEEAEDSYEVTHGVFFGENIKRIINTLR